MAFHEVESRNSDLFAFQCSCGHVIKKRRDSFLPGSHQMICIMCGHTSSEMELLTGAVVEQSDADHRQPTDFRPQDRTA